VVSTTRNYAQCFSKANALTICANIHIQSLINRRVSWNFNEKNPVRISLLETVNSVIIVDSRMILRILKKETMKRSLRKLGFVNNLRSMEIVSLGMAACSAMKAQSKVKEDKMAMKMKQERNQERTLKETTKRRVSAIIFRNSENVNMVMNAHFPMKQMEQTMEKSHRGRKRNLVKSVSTSRNLVDVNLEMNADFLMKNQQTMKEQVNLRALEQQNMTKIKMKCHKCSNLLNEISAGTFSSLGNANSAMIADLNILILPSR